MGYLVSRWCWLSGSSFWYKGFLRSHAKVVIMSAISDCFSERLHWLLAFASARIKEKWLITRGQ